jgi:hypothetical protein
MSLKRVTLLKVLNSVFVGEVKANIFGNLSKIDCRNRKDFVIGEANPA